MYTKEQILKSERCAYIREVAEILGRISWVEAGKFIKARLVTNSLRETNEILYALRIRK